MKTKHNKRIVYCISGLLPAPWEDFIPEDMALQKFTISTVINCKNVGLDTTVGASVSEDRWIDIVVDAKEITEEIVIDRIANFLSVGKHCIVIKQSSIAQAI